VAIGAEGDKTLTAKEIRATAKMENTAPIFIKDIVPDSMPETNRKSVADAILAWLSSMQ